MLRMIHIVIHLRILLEQHKEHLILLKNRWTNPFVSTARFDWHILDARARAEEMTGVTGENGSELTWIPSVIVPESDWFVDEVRDDNEHESEVPDISEVLAEDILLFPIASDDDEDRDFDDFDDRESAEDLNNSPLPVHIEHRLVEARESSELRITWKDRPELGVKYDEDISSFLELIHVSKDSRTISQSGPQYVLELNERGFFYFEETDIARLAKRTLMLNDQCINGGALLLQRLLSESREGTGARYTILSTFDLPRIRRCAPNDEIWRNIK